MFLDRFDILFLALVPVVVDIIVFLGPVRACVSEISNMVYDLAHLFIRCLLIDCVANWDTRAPMGQFAVIPGGDVFLL